MFRPSRRSRRGLTVVELGATVALLTVLLGGALLFVRPSLEADKSDAAVRDAMHIREAVLDWKDRGSPPGCPTVSQLLHEKKLEESSRLDDPWGGRFRIECSDEDVSVSSAGRDGKLGTGDDIRVPRSRS
jgi:general secretion pathway protein G